MVDVDDLPAHGFAEGGGEDLHVACEDDEVDVVFLDEFEDFAFLLGFGVLVHGEMMEGNVV